MADEAFQNLEALSSQHVDSDDALIAAIEACTLDTIKEIFITQKWTSPPDSSKFHGTALLRQLRLLHPLCFFLLNLNSLLRFFNSL